MKGNPIMPDDEFDALKTKVSLVLLVGRTLTTVWSR